MSSVVPVTSVTFGLAIVMGMNRSSGGFAPSSSQVKSASAGRTSTTQSWSAWPICCAARPMPSAACMVRTIALASCTTDASNTATFAPFLRKMGWL